MANTISGSLSAFLSSPQSAIWRDLPFFSNGEASRLCTDLDNRHTSGEHILPPPEDIFKTFLLTPFDSVKAVILGQDPYPTPGDAHGLAFSYIGGRRLPASLKTILEEVRSDIGGSTETAKLLDGNLTSWARQGVLLLNSALTVEKGNAGAHLKIGWSTLTDQAVQTISDKRQHIVFLLWGGAARARIPLIDQTKHLIVESGHPSPLNRLRDFRNSRPFSKTNHWLIEKGISPIDWMQPLGI